MRWQRMVLYKLCGVLLTIIKYVDYLPLKNLKNVLEEDGAL
jgi:hypothetical protein